MKQMINNCNVFFPQRILSVDGQEVSGIFLGDDSVSSVVIENHFEKVLQAQSDGKLTSNNQDAPTAMVLIDSNNNASVIYDSTKKVLFCQSYLLNGYVNIIKAAREKEFSSDDKFKCLEYIKSNIGKSKEAQERVEVIVDGHPKYFSFGDDIAIDSYLSATVIPYLMLPCSSILPISDRSFSMVVLDISSGIICKERFEIDTHENITPTILKSSDNESDKSGLEAYFDKIHVNS